jgi:hypothetical protein
MRTLRGCKRVRRIGFASVRIPATAMGYGFEIVLLKTAVCEVLDVSGRHRHTAKGEGRRDWLAVHADLSPWRRASAGVMRQEVGLPTKKI